MRAAPNRRYIVSAMVAQAVVAEEAELRGRGRSEYLLSPDTDKHAVRVEGRIAGTTRLVRAV